MKQLLIIFLCFIWVKASSQDCIDFKKPKFDTISQTMTKEYNVDDYEFKMVVKGTPPKTVTHYKEIIVRDGYTAIDSAKSKIEGRLCTKWVKPEKLTIVDWVETITPAVMPQFAWVKKENITFSSTIKTQKTIKDGFLTITNCN